MNALLAVLIAFPVVLMYHRVDVSAPEDYISQTLTIPPAQFAAELQYLHDKGLRTIGIDELVRDVRLHRSPVNAVLLTFDDGYSDQYRFAYPILRRYGDVATFFVNVGTLGTAGHMTWRDVERMARAGMSIGCHGVDHDDLSVMAISAQSYQIDRCIEELSAHLKGSVVAYAYPSGAFNAQTVRLEREAGVLLAFTTDPRFQRNVQSPYEIARRRIKSGMNSTDFGSLLQPYAYVDVPPLK